MSKFIIVGAKLTKYEIKMVIRVHKRIRYMNTINTKFRITKSSKELSNTIN